MELAPNGITHDMKPQWRGPCSEVFENLPQKYPDDDYRVKCETVYQRVYDSYYGEGRSVYAPALCEELGNLHRRPLAP